jgi:Ca2+-transporting ATPase
MTNYYSDISGLTEEQVTTSRATSGRNEIHTRSKNAVLSAIIDLLKEPMLILLIATATIYFISSQYGDGIFMLFAIVLVVTISLYQETRSRNALQALKQLSQPFSKVIRNGQLISINTSEIVMGDFIVAEEGVIIPADGIIIRCNDFSVNESILTGESLPVVKSIEEGFNRIFSGTSVTSGLAICQVSDIGNNTQLGKIGKSLDEIVPVITPLQLQISNFVKKMAVAGVIVFLIVWGINYYNSHNLPDSLLKALTLAMSILPEEIPVAFTTFMALGAWRLMKMGIIVKQTKTVETLGSATVLCTDKTGTITENKMVLAETYVWADHSVRTPEEFNTAEDLELIRFAMWSSEPIPFDPMEVALHDAYEQLPEEDIRSQFTIIREYPLEGTPPMMTHIFENNKGKRIIACKGAPEAILKVSKLTTAEQDLIKEQVLLMGEKGYRVLGVGNAVFTGDNFPEKQQDFLFSFSGLVAFYDPPKKNIKNVFKAFYKAGIQVKIITGDNQATTSTIARQVKFKGAKKVINGADLIDLTEQELKEQSEHRQIFTRMFPEAKLKVINALKANGHIVAMIGDGVNDAPALKSAHIGIAMGKKGSEIAKQASELILVEDDLSKLIDAIAMGRKIYSNLKKAIQYIISIHIPIILTVFIPLLLGWVYPNIFTPVHIIFLEMIMGPTCSIIYENEPMEKNTMTQPPRPFTITFFEWKELFTSIIQGLVITAGTLAVYLYAVDQGQNELVTRTMVFTALIAANIFLTLVNRSFYYSVLTTILYKNNLVPLIIGITVLIFGLILYVPVIRDFFQFSAINFTQLCFSITVGFVSVIWFEVFKIWSRAKSKKAKV